MRRAGALEAGALAGVAARLTADLPAGATVVDVGCGAGGMSAALAATLDTGARLVLVDATPELLAEAKSVAAQAADGVRIQTVEADVAAGLPAEVPPADLIWASHVVHHLPDQQAGVGLLAGALATGGLLALAEGGLDTRCLPQDVGPGGLGLEGRLLAARDEWFRELRETMPGSVRLPNGWNIALTDAGLTGVGSFSYLVEHPAPASPAVREYVAGHLGWLAEVLEERLGAEDLAAVRTLLDPEAAEYVGAREDVFLLGTRTVHYGRSS